jgi:hypothetical protein
MKDNTDLIEAYLNNELLGDDLLNFEKSLMHDAYLVDELALHRQIRGFVKENEVASLKNQVTEWLKTENDLEATKHKMPEPTQGTHEEEEKNNLILNSQPTKSTISLSFITKLAAGLAIVSGLSWYFFANKTPQHIENEYYAEMINQNPTQLQGADDRGIWAQAYRDKKYKSVIAILEKKTPITAEEIYYLGLAFSANSQFEKAIAQFSIKEITESVYAEKAEWAKALIYLKLYKRTEAKQILKKIENSDSEFRRLAPKIDL